MIALVFLVVGLTGQAQPGEQRVLIVEATVPLRAAPSMTAPVLDYLSLGVDRHVRDAGDGWLAFEFGRTLYFRADAARRVDDATIGQERESLIRLHVERRDQSHAAWNEVLQLIENESRNAAGLVARGRLALYELKALMGAGRSYRNIEFTPFERALRGDSTIFFLDTLAGDVWTVKNEHFRKVHARVIGSPAADDILWLAVENGSGECDGGIICPVEAIDTVVGEYLRHYPNGRHAPEALEYIVKRLDFRGRNPLTDDPYITKSAICGPLAAPLASLMKAVSGTSHASRDAALAPLRRLEAACR
ncbi:MAG: hypothetical protein WD690_00655 [Vicinamibacterales bacterium]